MFHRDSRFPDRGRVTYHPLHRVQPVKGPPAQSGLNGSVFMSLLYRDPAMEWAPLCLSPINGIHTRILFKAIIQVQCVSSCPSLFSSLTYLNDRRMHLPIAHL